MTGVQTCALPICACTVGWAAPLPKLTCPTRCLKLSAAGAAAATLADGMDAAGAGFVNGAGGGVNCGADGGAAASFSPSPDPLPSASEPVTPTPSPNGSPASPSPTIAVSPSPSASAGSGKTYVVQRGDSLYQIGIDLNITGGYKALAALNGISGPDYTIVPGQVLKLP